MQDSDYLIVGAGIAGSLLSRALARRGRSVLLVGSPEQPGSSPAAAWMLNPITGLRFSASWRIASLLPHALILYRELEQESGLGLLHTQRILRFFHSSGERSRWEKKNTDPLVRAYASLLEASPDHPLCRTMNTCGGLEIKGGGWVDLHAWISHHRRHPGPGIQVLSCHLKAEELTVENEMIRWKGRRFKKAIFCSGYSHWPWFDWLPWKASKGEVMTIRLPELELRDIVKKGIFLIPLGQDLYRLGATYGWSPLDGQPTEAGRESLLESLRAFVPGPVEVIAHHAGVRPSFQGTIPAIGLHPRHRSLGLFNGLGSKGGLSAPWLADRFTEHLEDGVPLDEEIDLARND